MSTEIIKVIEELGQEIERLARLVLKEQGIDEKTQLYEDLKVQVNVSGNSVVIDTYFHNYINYLETGRKPMTGKQPTIDALREWALSKKLPADNATLYAISHAIWRDGIEAKPILATLEKHVDEYMQTEFMDKLLDAIMNDLNRYFE